MLPKFLYSKSQVEQKLAAFNEKIRHHQLQEGPIAESMALIETLKAEGKNTAQIDEELAIRNLPSTQEVGKATLFNLYGWGSLNKKRVRLEKRLNNLIR